MYYSKVIRQNIVVRDNIISNDITIYVSTVSCDVVIFGMHFPFS